MDSAAEIPSWLMVALTVAGFLLVAASVAVYGGLIGRIVRNGGKVRTDNFGMPDLVVAGLLAVYFVFMIIHGVQAPPKPVHSEDIISSTVVFLIVVSFVCSFMHFRGIDLVAQFGIRRLGFLKVAGLAVLLMLAAYPLVGCASMVMQRALGPDAQPQELVKFFFNAAEKSNYGAIVSTMVMAVLVAPVLEEFVFRGYFHGILKRHFGILGATLMNASLFAAIHLSESSLLSLFVLAVCFTIAYEFTGSLLVNMCMHGVFNLTNLILLLYEAHHLVT